MSSVPCDLRQFSFDPGKIDKLTHYAFRYPAKFHPPIVKQLLSQFSEEGQTCLDPFCGSGTLLVEAAAAGRSAIGTDIDPLAVFVSRAKTHRYDPALLAARIEPVLKRIADLASKVPLQAENLLGDIDEELFHSIVERERLWIPAIPNLPHWFRRMVTIQLARILDVVDRSDLNADERQFLLLAFASIIRNVSNADPTPVSGLEVTSHMRKKEEAGRAIDPLQIFSRTVTKNLAGVQAYYQAAKPSAEIRVEHADARRLNEHGLMADVIITSPPYHNAVDYYRRHQLEMYWLKLVRSQTDRLYLLPGYIGRAHVAKRHALEIPSELSPEVALWDSAMREVSPKRADDFLQYVTSMRNTAAALATTLPVGAKAVFIVGNSKFQGKEIEARSLFPEIMAPDFRLIETYWYPVKNRYMSYSRRNDADINREFVLVFQKD